jgi:hypothetical protein
MKNNLCHQEEEQEEEFQLQAQDTPDGPEEE